MKTITVQSERETLEIEFVLSWDDVASAEQLRARQLREREGQVWPRRLVLLIPAAMTVIGVVLAWLGGIPNTLTTLALIALVASPLVAAGLSWWVLRQERLATSRARNQRPGKQRWIASSSGLTAHHGAAVIELPWPAIRRVQRVGSNLALFLDEMHYHLIPDRAFVTEQQQLRFVRLIKSNLAVSRS